MGNQNSNSGQQFPSYLEALDSDSSSRGFHRFRDTRDSSQYIGKALSNNNNKSIQEIQSIVQQKLQNPSPFVTQLVEAKKAQRQAYCTNQTIFHLLFRAPEKTLAQQFYFRKSVARSFTIEQIDNMVNRVAKGLKYLYRINHNHGRISMRAIEWPNNNKQIKIIDEWALNAEDDAPSKPCSFNKFQENPDEKQDQLSNDLYSLGLVGMDLVGGNYNPKLEIQKFSNGNFSSIQQQNLKKKLQVLCSKDTKTRLSIYEMLEHQNTPNNLHLVSHSPQIVHKPIPNSTSLNQVRAPPSIKFQNSVSTTTPHYFPNESVPINRFSNQSSQPMLYRTQNNPTTTRNSNSNSFSFPVPANVSFVKKNKYEVNQSEQKRLAPIQIKPNKKNLYPTPNAASVYVSPLKSKPSEHIFQKPMPMPRKPTKSIEQFKLEPEKPKVNLNSKQKRSIPALVNFNQKQKNQLGSVRQRNYIKPQVNFSNAHNLNTSTSISSQNQLSGKNIHQTPKFFNNIGFSVSNSDFHPSSIKSFENIQHHDSNNKSSFSHSKELQIPLIIQNMKNQFDTIKSGNHQQEQKFKLSTDIAQSLNLNSPSPINLQKSNKKQSPEDPNSISEHIEESSKQNHRQFIATPTSNMFNTIVQLSESANSVADQEREYVVQQYQNGSRYVGYKSNNMRNGKGKFYYQEGSFYDGEWKNNNMHGFGMLYYSNNKLAYEGQWYMDQFHGKGKVYNDEPQKLDGPFDYTNFQNLDQQWNYYEGTLVSDSKQGYGTLVLSNGQKYEGGFQNDNVHGRGKFYTISGQIIDGFWKNSILERRL